MDLATAFAEAVAAALQLWGTKEARKYEDKIAKLDRELYEAKQESRKDHRIIDDLEHKLFLLRRSAIADARKSKSVS